MISFCTGCCNRSEHIAATYEHNLDIGKDHEFILVNYGDKSGLDEYVKDKLMKYPNFTYYKTDAEYFHMSKAKNLSHRLATGDFLFCLDADTYICSSTIEHCLKALGQGKFLSSYCSTEQIYGICKDDFYRLGGYNESFDGWGFEDTDLAARCKIAGIEPHIPMPQMIRHIEHDISTKFINYKPGFRDGKLGVKSEIYNKHKRDKMFKVNQMGFAKHKVVKNFKEGFII